MPQSVIQDGGVGTNISAGTITSAMKMATTQSQPSLSTSLTSMVMRAIQTAIPSRFPSTRHLRHQNTTCTTRGPSWLSSSSLDSRSPRLHTLSTHVEDGRRIGRDRHQSHARGLISYCLSLAMSSWRNIFYE